jgi:hypothetical protein
MPHALAMTSFLIFTTETIVGSITNHEAPHYAVFSSLLSLPPFSPKYLPQHPILEDPYFPLVSETKFHTHVKE